MMPWGLSFNAMGMPVAGDATKYIDYLLAIPLDHQLETVTVMLQNQTSNGPGSCYLYLVQRRDDGVVERLTVPKLLNSNATQPFQLGRSERKMRSGAPVYLRIQAHVESGAGPAWWVGSSARGTIHLTAESVDS